MPATADYPARRLGSLAAIVIALAVATVACGPAFGAAHVGAQPFGLGESVVPLSGASLVVYPLLGQPGANVEFNGSGYAENSVVTVSTYSVGETFDVCTVESNASGSFHCSYQIPAMPEGAHVYWANDTSSDAASATLTVLPLLTVTPQSGPAGSTIALKGYGFASYTTNSHISWSYGSFCSVESGRLGDIPGGSGPCNLTIPAGTPAGPYVFTATDGDGNSNSTVFTVSYTPQFTVSPASGQAGTPLALRGSNYAPNVSVTVSLVSGVDSFAACTNLTNSSGAFDCNYTITGVTWGPHTLYANDSNGGSATASFTMTSRLTIAPASGAAGTTVALKGDGYASEVAYSIGWTGGAICTGTSGYLGYIPSGNLSDVCQLTIPEDTLPGVYTFTGTDADGHTNSTTFTVLAVPLVSMPSANRSSVDVGQAVTFSTEASGGSGIFSTYRWTPSSTSLGCASSNTSSITCRPTGPGNFTVSVTVTDSDGLSSASNTSALFTVYPVPVVLMPEANRSSADVGESVMFSAIASGGSGDDLFYWSDLPTGCVDSTLPTVSCPAVREAASYQVVVVLVDSNGASNTSPALPFTDYPDPTLSVAPTGPLTFVEGHVTVTLNATVVYTGANTILVEWFDSPTPACGANSSGPVGTGLSYRPTSASAGTQYYCAVVTDDGVPGYQSTSGAVEVVVTSPANSLILGLPPLEAYALFGAVGVAAACGCLALWLRSKGYRKT